MIVGERLSPQWLPAKTVPNSPKKNLSSGHDRIWPTSKHPSTSSSWMSCPEMPPARSSRTSCGCNGNKTAWPSTAKNLATMKAPAINVAEAFTCAEDRLHRCGLGRREALDTGDGIRDQSC